MGAGSVGSGLWSTQAPLFAHLAKGYHGLIGEVADVRRDLGIVLSPLKAVVVEEYDTPQPALPTAIVLVTATVLAAISLSGAALTGAIGATGVISPPRNVEVVTAGTTPTHAPATFTINGLDAWGRPLSETITGTSGGAATYAGVKCFAKVLSVVAPAATGTDATYSVGTGIVIGLSNYTKIRAGLALPLIGKEIVDGAAVTSGALTLSTTNPPFGAYTPATAPTTPSAGTETGSVDMTTAGLYGGSSTLDGLVLDMTVNGVHAALTFNKLTNAASESAALAAIAATFPGVTVTTAPSTNFLVLTDTLTGAEYSIVIAANGTSTANTTLGLTTGTYAGTGHLYAIDYEMDGTKQVSPSAIGMSGSSYGPIPGTVPSV
jgi:hypothetical protein